MLRPLLPGQTRPILFRFVLLIHRLTVLTLYHYLLLHPPVPALPLHTSFVFVSPWWRHEDGDCLTGKRPPLPPCVAQTRKTRDELDIELLMAEDEVIAALPAPPDFFPNVQVRRSRMPSPASSAAPEVWAPGAMLPPR